MEFFKKNWIKILTVSIAIIFVILAIVNKKQRENNSTQSVKNNTAKETQSNFRESDGKHLGGNNGGKGNQTFGTDKGGVSAVGDTNLQKVLDEVESKFKQLEFKDTQNGTSLYYNIFVPENYNSQKTYSMVLFIADSSVIGQNTKASLEQGYGGSIWATKANQQKNECIVVVPQYQNKIIDGNNASKELESTVNLIDFVKKEYNINKVYLTGQEMGGTAITYLMKENPNIFNAVLLVACEWDNFDINTLKNQKVLYVVAEGDEEANISQNNLITNLKNNNIKINQITCDSKLNNKEISNKLSNNSINFIKFKKGSVLEMDVSKSDEGIASYDCTYKIDAVRQWLLKQ